MSPMRSWLRAGALRRLFRPRNNMTFGGIRGVLLETLFGFFENYAAKQREERQAAQQHRTSSTGFERSGAREKNRANNAVSTISPDRRGRSDGRNAILPCAIRSKT